MSTGTVMNIGGTSRAVAGSFKATINAVADVEQTIPGGAFSQPLIQEPVNLVPVLAGVPVVGLAWSYAANGSVYDITIYPTEDFVNLKINVQC